MFTCESPVFNALGDSVSLGQGGQPAISTCDLGPVDFISGPLASLAYASVTPNYHGVLVQKAQTVHDPPYRPW